MYLLSQIIELVALIITLISYHLDTKKKIFKVMCFANILDIIHYMILDAYSGCFTKVIALFRNIFIIKKDNNKFNNMFALIVFLILYITLSILTYNGIISLFPFIAAIVYMIVVWDGDEINVKLIAFVCYIFWLIYNIFVFSIVGIISNIISLISTYIAYYNFKYKRNIQ